VRKKFIKVKKVRASPKWNSEELSSSNSIVQGFGLVFCVRLQQTFQTPGDSFLIGGSLGGPSSPKCRLS
jgi:hypothetical protein